MAIDIVLWTGGMLFTLGIFAVKVGFGLGFGRIKRKGVFLVLFLYPVIFVSIAMLSEQLIKILEPVLRKGPYLHALMALMMIAWGIYILRTQNTEYKTQTNTKCKTQNSKFGNSELRTLNPSLLLILPCPVCLTAITFSTWAALDVLKLPAPLVGLGLGIIFVALSLLFCISLKLITRRSSLITSRIGLGLSMMGIGLYFLASLFLPMKIEEAKGIYKSFLTEGGNIDVNNSIGVLVLLFVALIIGYLANKKQRVNK